MKLQYDGVESKKRDVKASVQRERDIATQLQDTEPSSQQDLHAANAKGSKKAPAKQTKNPDESLKEELDELRKLEVDGWILIGFPRSLTQMKLLEQSLSGFESKSDQSKPR